MVQSYLTYSILAWGLNYQRKVKQFMSIIINTNITLTHSHVLNHQNY